MNIFYVHPDPRIAAQSLVNSHVVKMPLESAQMLSTAHRVIDGKEIVLIKENLDTGRKRKKKVYILKDGQKGLHIYQATHINHPSSVWTRKSISNYFWLYDHFLSLLDEYTFRYGKIHKCSTLVPYLKDAPNYIKVENFTQPPCAMDEKYIISDDAVINYRNFYRLGKAHLHKYKNRTPPDWLEAK
jgi:hypothetical protein